MESPAEFAADLDGLAGVFWLIGEPAVAHHARALAAAVRAWADRVDGAAGVEPSPTGKGVGRWRAKRSGSSRAAKRS